MNRRELLELLVVVLFGVKFGREKPINPYATDEPLWFLLSEQEKINFWHREVIKLIQTTNGKLYIIGTRSHYKSFYGEIKDGNDR